ncbi:MAG: hypothetical protein OEW45_22330 [Deltaproteobacteria bacterium]|nr:hypothetical protein [Deltaproteobacteria bacterium]
MWPWRDGLTLREEVFHSASAIGHLSNRLKETIAGACVGFIFKRILLKLYPRKSRLQSGKRHPGVTTLKQVILRDKFESRSVHPTSMFLVVDYSTKDIYLSAEFVGYLRDKTENPGVIGVLKSL